MYHAINIWDTLILSIIHCLSEVKNLTRCPVFLPGNLAPSCLTAQPTYTNIHTLMYIYA